MDKIHKPSYYINMKENSGEIMTILGIIVTAIALVTGYGWHYFSKKNDTPVEQAAEMIIEKESGIKIDFSEADKQQKGANLE
jgi:hypothetical protein